jgi:large subunit ribosomal protein L18
MARTHQERRKFRRKHVRSKVRGSAARPRLMVYRSLKHVHAQLIDDDAGSTLIAASTCEKAMRGEKAKGVTMESAKKIGQLIGERAKAKNIESVIFDRGCFRYHGKVKAVADAAREQGLKF